MRALLRRSALWERNIRERIRLAFMSATGRGGLPSSERIQLDEGLRADGIEPERCEYRHKHLQGMRCFHRATENAGLVWQVVEILL